MLERITGMERARSEALTLLEKFGVESVEHLRVDGFAHRLGVELVETEMDGASGQLVVHPDGATIVLPEHLKNWAERRWSIAHELGHFVLGHRARPARELCGPRVRRRRRDRRHHEDEADNFAASLLIPDAILAKVCDVRPMTLDVPAMLAAACDVPWAACAGRLMQVTWRVCAILVSQHGVNLGGWQSLLFAMLFAGKIYRDDPLRPGSLAHRFFETGEPCGPPALVPASAWLDEIGAELQLHEHSLACTTSDAVVTMLWAPDEPVATRPPGYTLEMMALCHDHIVAELEASLSCARVPT
jgi:Zn-dependent peptidase ImmA (M78 family)